MSKKMELLKNTVILLIGKASSQIVSFLLLPLYTYVLSTSDYGTVDLFITYIGLLVPLITLQLESAVFRFLIDERENSEGKKRIISNVSITTIILLMIGLIIYIPIVVLFNFKYKTYVLICIVTTIFSNILLQMARGLGDNTKYSIACVITGISNIIFNLLFLLVFKTGASGVLLASSISNLLCSIYIFYSKKIYKYIEKKCISKKEVKDILSYSLPLVPNSIIWWIINVSDRTIITFFIGAAANGVYAISNKFSALFINIYNVFNMSWTESAAMHIESDDKDSFFSDTFRTTIKLFSCIGMVIIAIIPFIFKILIGEDYNDAYKYIPLLIIGSLFNIVVSFIGGIYVAKKLTKQVTLTSFFSGLINIVINIVFIKNIGIYAAAISTIVAFASMSVYRIIDVQKYIKLKIETRTILRICIMFIIICMLYYKNQFIYSIINIVIVIIYSLIENKNILFSIKDFKKNLIKK